MPKLATWNVNSIAIRLPRLQQFLARERPDVVCLQELKCADDKVPVAEFAALGYHAAFLGQKTYNGVAVLSRVAPEQVIKGFADGVDDPAARFVGARVGGVTYYSAYVPNGQTVGSDKYFYKLNWLARLRRFLDREHRPGDQIVIAGDYNVAPEDRDVHDPAAWKGQLLCSDREREALAHAQAFGLVDAYRRLHPAETQYTWWDYRMLAFPKNHGLRIDLILATPALAERVTACWVARDERQGEKPSDHAPVVVEFADG
jgi:exodeoxyribonuclease-3